MIVAALAPAACKKDNSSSRPAPSSSLPDSARADSVAVDGIPTIVFVGTSLTAGFGLADPSLAYPALIQRKLDSAGLRFRVVNAGVSGETSAGALRRVDWLLRRGKIAVLVVETGANDGLRGQDPDTVRANIQAIFDRAKQLDPPPRLVLAGMEAMPNLGRDYTTRFRAIFPELARTNNAALVPFLLEGVAGVDSLNQVDGIHPTARGHEIVAENVWKQVSGISYQVSGHRP